MARNQSNRHDASHIDSSYNLRSCSEVDSASQASSSTYGDNTILPSVASSKAELCFFDPDGGDNGASNGATLSCAEFSSPSSLTRQSIHSSDDNPSLMSLDSSLLGSSLLQNINVSSDRSCSNGQNDNFLGQGSYSDCSVLDRNKDATEINVNAAASKTEGRCFHSNELSVNDSSNLSSTTSVVAGISNQPIIHGSETTSPVAAFHTPNGTTPNVARILTSPPISLASFLKNAGLHNEPRTCVHNGSVSSQKTDSDKSLAESYSTPCYSPDSFANVGRGLMTACLSSEFASDANINYNGEEKETSDVSSLCKASFCTGANWWSQLRTESDWESFQLKAKECLDILLSEENDDWKDRQIENELNKRGKPTGSGEEEKIDETKALSRLQRLRNMLGQTDHTQTAESGASFVDPAIPKQALILTKHILEVKSQLKMLPIAPPSLSKCDSTISSSILPKETEKSSLSTASDLKCNESPLSNVPPQLQCDALIPLHFLCPICQDIVIGATLIECQKCPGSISNSGCSTFCRKCLEEMTPIQQNNHHNLICCPFCKRDYSLKNQNELQPTFCKPVPCHALDIAICNTVTNIGSLGLVATTLEDSNFGDEPSMLLSHQMMNRYGERLNQWRTSLLARRKVLEVECARSQDMLVALVVKAEEDLLWAHEKMGRNNLVWNENGEKENRKSEVEDGKDSCNVLGAVNADGYVEVIEKESPWWDELSDSIAASQSRCMSAVHAVFIATVTAGFGVFLAFQSRQK